MVKGKYLGMWLPLKGTFKGTCSLKLKWGETH